MQFSLKGDYFDGSFVIPSFENLKSSPQKISKYCPGDLETLLWELPICYDHVDAVVESASNGYKTWRKTNIEERVSALRRFQEQVIARKDEIAKAIALETGKPLWESLTEASALAAKVNVSIENSLNRIKAQHFNQIMPGTNGSIHFKPIGVCFVIGPFNFPCHLANGQIVNSLLAGNSIIFKPSEKTVYSGQILMECFDKAEFPKGVVNLIQGDGETAARIIREKSVKGVFFTGSKEVGQKILSSTHQDLSKLVALELGGKNSSIIHHDADVSMVIPELLKACFMTTGQRCVSTSLVPIHESIADEFISKFHSYTKRLIIDHPTNYEIEPFMGPLIDQQSVDNYLNYMGMAKREGIEEIMRGKKINKKFQGHYVSPSIHLATPDQMNSSHFMTSELFGPNCTFVKYKEIEEAIQVANGTEYGLAASIFTKDLSTFEFCRDEIECGQFNLNRSTVGASSALPFGGVKSSGNYRPAAVSFIDSCAYAQSSLQLETGEAEDPEKMRGMN